MIQPSRRGFITGLIAFAAAPAIVRASSLMPVKAMVPNANVFSIGADCCNASVWLVQWGEKTIYRAIIPDDWRSAIPLNKIETSDPLWVPT